MPKRAPVKALLEYCASQGITFTRSRPYLKNDTCHIEQKNWAVVRRLVGYDRLELPALAARSVLTNGATFKA